MKNSTFIKISSILMICIFSFLFSFESKAVNLDTIFSVNNLKWKAQNGASFTYRSSQNIYGSIFYLGGSTPTMIFLNGDSLNKQSSAEINEYRYDVIFDSSLRNINSAINIDGTIYYYYYRGTSFGDTYYRLTSDLSPVLPNNITTIESAIRYMLEYQVTFDDLGYIKEVGYHVDANGLENNPVGKNEVVTWGQYSTTDIDLSQSRYQVEFMLRDTSMTFKNSISNSLDGWINLPNPIPSTLDFAVDTYFNISSLFVDDDDEKAFRQGKAVPAETYGKCISITTVQASNSQVSLASMPVYKIWASDGSTQYKEYINEVTGASSRDDWYGKAASFFNSRLQYYNLSYDILARIIDTTTGNKGDWLLIDKHNTPYINSDRSDRLNGGVTAVTGIRFPDYNPTDDDFTDPPIEEPAYQPDYETEPIYLPTPISTGYVINESGSSSSSSSSTLINNYYNTTYVYNYGDQISNINIDNTDYNNFSEGIDTIKSLPNFLGLYLTFFGSFLPSWAVAIVSICIPLLISIIVIRIVKGVLPFV